MPEKPLVYKTDKIESLEHYRQRYEAAGTKERKKLALLHAQTMHVLLTDVMEEIRLLRQEIQQLLRGDNR